MKARFVSMAALLLALAVGFTATLTYAAGAAPAAPGAGGGKKGGGHAITLDEVKTLLKGISSVRVMEVGDAIVLDGTISTPYAAERITRLTEVFDNIVNLTQREDDKEFNQIMVEELTKKIGLDGVKISILQGALVLEGEVANETDSKNAEKIAKAYFEKTINNLGLRDTMIEVDLAFVQTTVDKSLTLANNPLKNVAFTAGGGITGSVPIRPVGKSLADSSYNFGANTSWVFSFIDNDSDSKVLNRPHLSTLSRSKASFHQGGEKGFRVINQTAANVTFKEFGLILEVTPEATKDGLIRCVVSFEVSAPTSTGEGLDFTKFKTVATTIIRPGDSLVLAGLLQEIKTKFNTGFPILRRIPIFGAFFTEQGKDNKRDDLMVVITPYVPTVNKALPVSVAKEQSDRWRPADHVWTPAELNELQKIDKVKIKQDEREREEHFDGIEKDRKKAEKEAREAAKGDKKAAQSKTSAPEAAPVSVTRNEESSDVIRVKADGSTASVSATPAPNEPVVSNAKTDYQPVAEEVSVPEKK